MGKENAKKKSKCDPKTRHQILLPKMGPNSPPPLKQPFHEPCCPLKQGPLFVPILGPVLAPISVFLRFGFAFLLHYFDS